jgi:hypothetical protein
LDDFESRRRWGMGGGMPVNSRLRESRGELERKDWQTYRRQLRLARR